MPPAERSTRAKRRAPVACRFCRKRKMKCNNSQPSCGNCDEYGKVCVYDELAKRPRPSNSRIANLEAENRRLQAAAQGLHPGDSSRRSDEAVVPQQFSDVGRNHDDDYRASRLSSSPLPEHRPGETSITRDTITPAPSTPHLDNRCPPSGPVPSRRPARDAVIQRSGPGDDPDAYYHGPTSTLFDDTTARAARARQLALHNRHDASAAWTRKSLLAEAASQRHLETINLAAGKLNFDGVDPDLGMHLLKLHWNRQHHSFLITYRPAFMRDMACAGPYFSPLLLNAIFFGASKFSNRPEVRRDPSDVRTAGWLFRQRVRELLGGALDRSDITTIQALLIMTSSLFALGDERSAAWLYAGTAFRMIIDLGLHVDAEYLAAYPHLTDEDVEIRRRVFWGAFVVDKIQSLYQGRPVSLQEMDHSVPIAFYDEYEELEHWQPFAYSVEGVRSDYPGCPAYSVSCFTQLCRLSLIMTRILNKVYAERSAKKSQSELEEDLKSLQADLEAWKAELPPHLLFDPTDKNSTAVTPPPHVISLLAMYNVLIILLHRPFVSDGHLHANMRALAASSFFTCATAASTIVSLLSAYHATFSIRRAPYLISYATYVAATIHVRMAAQPGAWGKEAKEKLAVCLRIFEGNQETNWAVRKARTVVGNLMKKMNVTVDPDEMASQNDEAAGATVSENEASEKQPATGREAVETSIEASNTNADIRQGGNDSAHDSTVNRASLAGSESRDDPVTANEQRPFDIDAIISSFMSPSNQTLQAEPQQPIPPIPDVHYYPQSQYMQHSHPLANPRAARPCHHCSQGYEHHGVPTAAANHNPIIGASPWYGGHADMPTPASSSSHPDTVGPRIQPHLHQSFEPLSALPDDQQQQQLGHYPYYGRGVSQSHLGSSGMGPEGGPRQDWQTRVPTDVSDMLFGFNSSAMEGLGWEFYGPVR